MDILFDCNIYWIEKSLLIANNMQNIQHSSNWPCLIYLSFPTMVLVGFRWIINKKSWVKKNHQRKIAFNKQNIYRYVQLEWWRLWDRSNWLIIYSPPALDRVSVTFFSRTCTTIDSIPEIHIYNWRVFKLFASNFDAILTIHFGNYISYPHLALGTLQICC